MSKSRKRTRPYTKPHNMNLNVYGIGAAKVERLLHGETEAEKLLREQQLEQEAARAVLREARDLASHKLHTQKIEEKAMSALRESLEKAIADKEARAAKLQATLDDWGDDEPVNNKPTTKETTIMTQPKLPAPGVTISEATFNFVRNNPSQTGKDIVAMLTRLYAYNPTSTASLLSQMVRQGLIGRDGRLLYAIAENYTPIKSKDAFKRQQTNDAKKVAPAPAAYQPKAEAPTGGIAALASKPDVAYNISSLLDNISVNEARALYIELKKLFGGN